MADLVPAPIALFVYNRPEHTRRTLETLAANPLAERSALTVFSDGPKAGQEEAVAKVRAIVRERPWCGRVELVALESNRGLAANIVAGISQTLEQSDRVIVLEDDLQLSPGFLAYMNDALTLYADEPRVTTVSGYLPKLGIELPETFFLRTGSSWGWATWRRAWQTFEPDARALMSCIEEAGRVSEFNLDGAYDYFLQLRLNAEGKLKTWAIQWYASIFLADGLNLHPKKSLVENIGHDGSGLHCRPNPHFAVGPLCPSIRVEPIPIEAHAAARAAFAEKLRRASTPPLAQRMKSRLRPLLRRFSGIRLR